MLSFVVPGTYVMDVVFQYEIPYLHPLVVHFPLALILVGALTVFLWLIRGTVFWQRCALFLYSLGMAGALLAYFTGEAMEEAVEGAAIVEELVELHEQMALYTLLFTGLTLAGLVGMAVWAHYRPIARPQGDPILLRVLLGLLALLSAVLVAWTAHIGGTMVWGVAR
ncbi:hypothetical protein GQ464_017765 [Rhodocaloribacter litoris]|uniref:DUF2231 domain-containing protein n=1 Tax=Rhodocaloribacter litoris TaxID=2558931 RepID=UPI001421E4EE|nr:DUF2231 domain-containing protein [Rhodocaloribacter litoris]QXD15223.1 hypothetical protein GQ464_017765 [Rhodocaloribacter litoris]